MKRKNSYLRGMTCVASGAPEIEVKKILHQYERKVPGIRSTLSYSTGPGKHTLYLPVADAKLLGLPKK